MSGAVEVDETFIGGKAQFMHKRKREKVVQGRIWAGKTDVMGFLERTSGDKSSSVKTKVIPNTKRSPLSPEVRQNAAPGSNLYTSAHSGYTGLAADYIHEFLPTPFCPRQRVRPGQKSTPTAWRTFGAY
jgi:hypothetical protein